MQVMEKTEDIEGIRNKLKICISALRKISKSTRMVQGDYTYDQSYNAPTDDSYTAKNALEKLKGIKTCK